MGSILKRKLVKQCIPSVKKDSRLSPVNFSLSLSLSKYVIHLLRPYHCSAWRIYSHFLYRCSSHVRCVRTNLL